MNTNAFLSLFYATAVVVVLALVECDVRCSGGSVVPPPLPILPVPTSAQLKWQRRELIMFFHFGMNTFTDSEWGTGRESPALFHPSGLDADQWMDAAASAGASLVILVAKHHDGFCLWPSKYTNHTVESSPWKGGKGDVVREVTEAAKARGLDVGLYLSPWDRHEKSYGRDQQYNEYYLAQLEELLRRSGVIYSPVMLTSLSSSALFSLFRYGHISEIWFDGAKGKEAANMTYYFKHWFSIVKGLQTSINIFSDAGPDIRWVGNEQGYAGTTCWSPVNRTMLRIGATNITRYQNSGDANGVDWIPPECDVSISKGWFWHENDNPKSLTQLLDIYYKSVGRNCVLLLNVPPNTTGLVPEQDIGRLKEFRDAVNTIFTHDLTKSTKCVATASSQRGGSGGGFGPRHVLEGDDDDTYWAPEDEKDEHWVELRWEDGPVKFNVVRIEEPIWMGQRIRSHEVWVDGRVAVADGTTVGHRRLHRLKGRVVKARRLRIRITGWRSDGEVGSAPLLSAVGVHYDPFWDGQITGA